MPEQYRMLVGLGVLIVALQLVFRYRPWRFLLPFVRAWRAHG